MTEFIPAQVTPVRRRRRGRPPSKPQLRQRGESTLPIAITSPLNVSGNSAAVLRQGVCSTPVMRLSPRKISRRSSVRRSSTRKNHPHTAATAATGETSGEAAGLSPASDLAPVSPTPRPGSRRRIPGRKITSSRSATAVAISGASATMGALSSYVLRTPLQRAAVLTSSSPSSGFSSSPMKNSSSPLKTSPVSTLELGKIGLLPGGMMASPLPAIKYNTIESPGSGANVNPSLLNSTTAPVGSSIDLQRGFQSSPIRHDHQVRMKRAYSGNSTPKTSNFSSIINSSPMYTHWYSQTPAQTTLIATPGGSSVYRGPLVPPPTVQIPRTADFDQDNQLPPSKKAKLLPANYKLTVRINSSGKAMVVVERKPSEIPTTGIPNGLVAAATTATATGGFATPNSTALRQGIDPYVNGVSSNEFDTIPSFHTPTKSPYSATPISNLPKDTDQMIFTGDESFSDSAAARKYDARFAVQALLDDL